MVDYSRDKNETCAVVGRGQECPTYCQTKGSEILKGGRGLEK